VEPLERKRKPVPLQNHPGDTEFPVRVRTRHARAIEQWRRQYQPRANGARALLVTAGTIPFAAVGFAIAYAIAPDGRELANPFFGGVAGLLVGLIVSAAAWSRVDAAAPRRAQRAYLAAARVAPLTERRQQILALDAASDFSFGGWNSSLAFGAAWIELPAQMRERWADGAKGSPWPVLPMARLAQLRVDLDTSFKIASSTDAEMMVADTLATGPLSRRFAEVAASPDAEAMASRVAALAGVPVFDVLELAGAPEGEEPELLLAADVERTIGGVRYAYMAGYLTAERAWDLLGSVAARAFDRYDGFDAYWRAVAVATAFRSDSLEAVENLRANLAGLRDKGWPAASVDYPARDRVR
jgi:hypothetical protein